MRRQALSVVRSALRASEELTTKKSTTTTATLFAIRRGYADDANLLKTPLYDFHVAHGGRSNQPIHAFVAIFSKPITPLPPRR